MGLITADRHALFGESRWRIWTTDAQLVVTEPDAIAEARRIADRWLNDIDEAASRFRDDSEVCRLAATGSDGAIISQILAELLRGALEAAASTDGAVDPTVGSLCNADGAGNLSLRPAPGWRSIRLVGDRLWLPMGVLLDLGATAKALAADLVAEDIAKRLDVGVLVGLGGDLRVAGHDAPQGGWVVLVQDGPDQPSTTVRLTGAKALATSSTLHRTWRQGRRLLHHVIDPATCKPAPKIWRTATVAASSCLRANTLSTACLVWGTQAPGSIAQAGVAARLVAANGRITTFAGFPA